MPNDIPPLTPLLHLGLNSALLPPNLTHEQAGFLYNILIEFPEDWISESWQIPAILGDLTAYTHPDKKDRWHIGMGHYAALSGKIDALKQVINKKPSLFFEKDSAGRTLVFYGILSGHPEIMDWIKVNRPKWSREKLFSAVDRSGETIAHYAARRDITMLTWISKNRPDLLAIKNNAIVIQAALSGNALLLNFALSLSETPWQINLANLNGKQFRKAIQTLLRVLQNNETLYQWSALPPIPAMDMNREQTQLVKHEIQEINRLFARNKSIFPLLSNINRALFDLMHALYVPKDIWRIIFDFAVYSTARLMPEKNTAAQFNKLINLKCPKIRQQIMTINATTATLQAQKKHYSNSLEPAIDQCINDLITLKSVMLSQHMVDLQVFDARYKTIINTPLTLPGSLKANLLQFFKPSKPKQPHNALEIIICSNSMQA